MSYGELFQELTGGYRPLPWQSRLADGGWPDLLDIPTGLGKTAGVVCAWIWRRLHRADDTGRRLVYCLPMRSLVEQVAGSCREWCERAAPFFAESERPPPTVHVLMGGEAEEEWELRPGADAIVVGTQDMLLSRALCRGYGMNRYRWPVPFGLLSGDCLWVLDETQLMGVGVETSSQLQALRGVLGTYGAARTLWMSATLDPRRLRTVDRASAADGDRILSLDDADRADAIVTARCEARKPLVREEGFRLEKDDAAYARAVADRAAAAHRERGGLTLVLLNRVFRAQAVYSALGSSGIDESECSLVHSRFRPGDRAAAEQLLFREGGRIVVATQAIEAGIDASARTLITELAPFPSIVQRLGRLNRYGEEPDALAIWIDVDSAGGGSAERCLPYDTSEIDDARRILMALKDAGPDTLGGVSHEPPLPVRPVLRRKDLVDLFDTSPDLLGFDLDVSRYVRDGEDTDVFFFWRDLGSDGPSADEPAPEAEEICRVSIGAARAFLAGLDRARRRRRTEEDRARLQAYRWDPLGGEHLRAEEVRPGEILLFHPGAGGYDPALGFTGRPGEMVPVVTASGPDSPRGPEAMDADPATSIGRWVRLCEHLGHVAGEARELVRALDLPADASDAVVTAAAWHDVGKAHAEFQRRLTEPVADDPGRPPGEGPWAKSDHRLRAKPGRPGFRHELASALAWLQSLTGVQGHDLVAYLVAAHHGKVRLSIRSLPTEREPEPDRPFARGVWDEDPLPAVDLPGGGRVGPLTLDLSPVAMGEGSWLERTLALRDAADLGPFRLAFLETLVRVADWRASRKEARDGNA